MKTSPGRCYCSSQVCPEGGANVSNVFFYLRFPHSFHAFGNNTCIYNALLIIDSLYPLHVCCAMFICFIFMLGLLLLLYYLSILTRKHIIVTIFTKSNHFGTFSNGFESSLTSVCFSLINWWRDWGHTACLLKGVNPHSVEQHCLCISVWGGELCWQIRDWADRMLCRLSCVHGVSECSVLFS